MHALSRLLLFGLLIPVLASPAIGLAQAPVEPGHADIAAYLHIQDVRALSRQCAEILRDTGRPADDMLVAQLFARALCDQYMALVQPGHPFTIVCMRAPDGATQLVYVLPHVPDSRYLDACAIDAGMRAIRREEVSILAPAKSESWLSKEMLDAAQALHEAVHPCDFVFYARTVVLQHAADSVEQAVQLIDMGGMAAATSRNKPPVLAAPVAPGSARKPPAVAAAQNMAKQVQWLAVLLSLDARPTRLMLEIQAVEGSQLARFFSSPAPKANALSRYIESDGWLRAAGEIDGPALCETIDTVILPEDCPQWLRSLKAALVMSGGPAALRLADDGYTAILEPARYHRALRQFTDFLEKHRDTHSIARKNADVFEKFEITQFSAGGAENVVAAAAYLGQDVAFCAPADRIRPLIRRMILIDVPGDPLLSQQAFVAGGNLYVDIRTPVAAGPWQPDHAMLVSARWSQGMAQVAITLAPQALAGFAKPATPDAAPPPAPVPAPDGSLPSPIAP